MTHIIYGLYSSLDASETIRYVGYTSFALERRIREHRSEAKKGRSHRHKWVLSVIAAGGEIKGRILETCSRDDWQQREAYWIASMAENRLVNATAGGEGLVAPTEDVRKRIARRVSESLLGNQHRLGISHSLQERRLMSERIKASPAFQAAMAARRGKPGRTLSDEVRAKIAAAKRGVKRPDMAARMRGNTLGANVRHTEEFKAKVAERNREAAGCKWITNGADVARLPKDADLPDGWRFGRK